MTTDKSVDTEKWIHKGLIIKEPWISMILAGEKTMEMRKTRVHIRGRIALLNKGFIRGFATLYRCDGPLSYQELISRGNEHRIPDEKIGTIDYPYKYGWMLTDEENLLSPIKYDHPHGAQIWVNFAK